MVPISTRAWVAGGLLVAGFLVAWNWQGNRYEARLSDLRAQHAEEIAASHERARLIQEGWSAVLIEVRKDAQQRQKELEIDLADSVSTNGRLRERLSEYSDRPASDASATGGSVPACPSERVLAQLLERTDELAGIYAEYAGRLEVAGSVCIEYAERMAGQ